MANVAHVFLRGRLEELERVLAGPVAAAVPHVFHVAVQVARVLAAKSLPVPLGRVLVEANSLFQPAKLISSLATGATRISQLLEAADVLEYTAAVRGDVTWEAHQQHGRQEKKRHGHNHRIRRHGFRCAEVLETLLRPPTKPRNRTRAPTSLSVRTRHSESLLQWRQNDALSQELECPGGVLLRRIARLVSVS